MGDAYGLRRPAFVRRPPRDATPPGSAAPHGSRQGLDGVSVALCLVSACALAADADKTSGPTPTRGSSHSLRSLCSFIEML